MDKKVVLITGASSGMGKETAKLLLQKGYIVYVAARRVVMMEDLGRLGAKVLAMDVTDDAAMVKGIATIVQAEGRIDVLVNNAGFGSYGAVEDVPISDAKYQLDVNVFGAARLIQLVLPHMRQQHFGRIINISSIGGKIATPLGAWYHASKFALEGLSDSLRGEVKSFGIDVVVIEPGGVKSEWSDIAAENLVKISGNGAYKSFVKKFADLIKSQGHRASEPGVIATLIQRAIEAKQPKTRYKGGFGATPLLFLRKVLSDRMMDKIFMFPLK
ncbi:MAG: oxidoreductase [Flavipsychrobacter sp.]|nr:oxidoreductase [Flavipsychrobacter sp.]